MRGLASRKRRKEVPFCTTRDGVRLAVRVTPKAERDELAGLVRDAAGCPALHLRLTALPIEGAANAALISFLARSLGLRKAQINIRVGETARLKIVHLSGEPVTIIARLTEWITNPVSRR